MEEELGQSVHVLKVECAWTPGAVKARCPLLLEWLRTDHHLKRLQIKERSSGRGHGKGGQVQRDRGTPLLLCVADWPNYQKDRFLGVCKKIVSRIQTSFQLDTSGNLEQAPDHAQQYVGREPQLGSGEPQPTTSTVWRFSFHEQVGGGRGPPTRRAASVMPGRRLWRGVRRVSSAPPKWTRVRAQPAGEPTAEVAASAAAAPATQRGTSNKMATGWRPTAKRASTTPPSAATAAAAVASGGGSGPPVSFLMPTAKKLPSGVVFRFNYRSSRRRSIFAASPGHVAST